MALTPLNPAQRQAAITIGRSYWATAFRQQYPTATKEQKLASWKEHRKQYVQLGAVAVRHMLRAGFQITGGGVVRAKRATK